MNIITTDDVGNLNISKYSKFYRNLRLELTDSKGRGVFAKKSFTKGEVIEVAPVILDSKQTAFVDYIFDSAHPDYKSMLVLGYGSIYNHANKPNVKYYLLDFDKNDPDQSQMFNVYYADRYIEQGEELTISYGTEWWKSRQVRPSRG